MAVHAHPDDEAIGTGGILARYAAEGVRTVLVTCTNGELGDAPGGLKPDDPGHDERVVVPLRRRELEASCEILGVSQLELLGYHDSGMEGWPQNDVPDSFWHTPVEDAARRLADLMRTYEPQVVVTYDENGFYGHPDHIQANRVTRAALAECGIPAKLYYTAVARSRCRGSATCWRRPASRSRPRCRRTPTSARPTSSSRRRSTAARSPGANTPRSRPRQPERQHLLPRDGRGAVLDGHGIRELRAGPDPTNAPVPEDDLFAGLR